MAEFFRSQLDYVFFFYGLAFLLLAVVTYGLRRIEPRLPWNWLCLFALTHGFNEWLDMLAISLGDAPWFAIARLVLMIVSFLCLAEFGRIGCRRMWGRWPGLWVYISLIGLALPGALAGLSGLNAASRYAFGLLGGLAAAAALYGASRTQAPGRRSLRVAAWMVALYAIAAGAVVPKAAFWPALWVNHDSFLAAVHAPVQLLRGLLACTITWAIWTYFTVRTRADGRTTERGDRRFAQVLAVSLAGVVAGGWFFAQYLADREGDIRRQHVVNLAEQYACGVSARDIEKLTGNESDLGRPLYQGIKAQLMSWGHNQPNIRFTYLLRRVDETIVFLADSESPGSKDYSPPGQVFEEASPALLAMFQTGIPLVEGPVTDRWGTWVSGLCPIVDGHSGKVVAVMGVDTDAAEMAAAMAAGKLRGIGLLAMVSVAILLAFMARGQFRSALARNEYSGAPHKWLGALTSGGIGIVGAAITLVVFQEVQNRNRRIFADTFQRQSSARIDAIQVALGHVLSDLNAVHHHRQATGDIIRTKWQSFVRQTVGEDAYTQATEWVPRIRQDRRADFETEAKKDGLAGFRITERDAQGQLVPAARREEYFPASCVQPMEGNEGDLGFDLASDPALRAAMQTACDSGQTQVATSPVPDAAGPNGRIMVFIPVFQGGALPPTLRERRRQLEGFTLGVYRAAGLFEHSLAGITPMGLSFLVENTPPHTQGRIVYFHKSRVDSPVASWEPGTAMAQAQRLVDFAGKTYRITVVPGETFVQMHFSRAHWWVLPIGFAFTAVGAFCASILLLGRLKIERLVRTRTDALRESQERLENTIKGTNAGTWEWNVQTGETVFNERWAEIVGYRLDELAPVSIETWLKLVHPDDLKVSGAALERHFRGESDYYDCECRMKHKDGRWVWIWDRGRVATWDGRGKPLWMYGTHQDVTERKEAQQALHESEQRFKAVMHSSEDAILLIGNNRFVDCNEAAARMLGYVNRSEMLMTHPSELSPPAQPDGQDSRDKAEEMIRQAVGKGHHRFEWVHRKANGEDFPVEVSLTPIVCEGKSLLYCVWRDISERKQMAAALESERATLRTVFEFSPTGLLVLDDEFHIVRTNKAATNLLARTEAALLGHRPGEAMGCAHSTGDPRGCGFAASCSRCPLRKSIGSVISTRDPVRGQEIAVEVVQDGKRQTVWLRVSAEPIQIGGRPHVVVSLSDITSQKREEADLAVAVARANDMAAEAEAANAIKSEFLANMSHEIRTPMTAILGFTDLLGDSLDTCAGRPCSIQPEKIAVRNEHLKTIRRNGEHLLGLINDILDLSKIEAGRMQVERVECQPVRIIEDVLSLLRVKAIEKGLTLEGHYSLPLPGAVWSDPVRLRQILVNLAGNAIKFTRQGQITISLQLVQGPDGSDLLQFAVTDTGIGMTSEQMAGLFRPFTQADASTTRQFGGTGLGLAICKKLARALGGDIHVASSPNQGSTFTLIIKADVVSSFGTITELCDMPSRAAARAQEAVVQPAHISGRMLLAEDGRDNQVLISTIVRKAGADVDIVGNGRLAIEAVVSARAAGKPYDVILMDMQMPEMDGYEAASRLRAMGVATPIVALTAHAMAGDRQKCLDAGCSEYATKPIHRVSFLALLAGLLGQTSTPASEAASAPAQEATAGPAADVLHSTFRDDPDIAELIPAFLSSLPDQLSDMRLALQHNDFPRLTRLAHQLKGAGGGYGYPTVTQAALNVEQAGKAGDREQASLRLNELEQLCRQARAGMPSAKTSETPSP